MKKTTVLNITLAALILSVAGFASASQEVNATQADTLMKFDVVSAGPAYSLDDLNNQLRMKAEAAGASSYSITSASGNNMLSGTANLYR